MLNYGSITQYLFDKNPIKYFTQTTPTTYSSHYYTQPATTRYSITWKSTSIGEYEIYNLNRTISLETGETKNIPLFSGIVSFKREYVWDARGETNYYSYSSWETEKEKNVQVIYEILNEGRTWSHGTVYVYKEGILIGADSIEWTPKGREGKVTVGMAPDIEVKKSHTTKKVAEQYKYDHTVTLWLKNYKQEKATVKVMDEFSSSAMNLKATEAYTEKPGNLMEWELNIEPGQEKTVTYTYYTT